MQLLECFRRWLQIKSTSTILYDIQVCKSWWDYFNRFIISFFISIASRCTYSGGQWGRKSFKWRQCEVMCSFNQLLKTYGQLILIDSPELSCGPRTKTERKEKGLQIIILINNMVKDFKSAFGNKDRNRQKSSELRLIMWPKHFYTYQWFSKAISAVSLPLSLSFFSPKSSLMQQSIRPQSLRW